MRSWSRFGAMISHAEALARGGASADALDDLQHNILSLITLIMYIKHNITDAT